MSLTSAAAPASPQEAVLSVDCARPVLPGLREVAELAGIANPGQAYAVRARLMLDVRRACKRGAVQVQLVRERAEVGEEPAVAVVDAALP